VWVFLDAGVEFNADNAALGWTRGHVELFGRALLVSGRAREGRLHNRSKLFDQCGNAVEMPVHVALFFQNPLNFGDSLDPCRASELKCALDG
jgi:hypothetical protein